MIFKNLRLKNFRNFNEAEILFSQRLNFFLGDNGQGKSNLLEALSLFSTGDSFRYSDNSVLIHHQHNESLLVTEISNQNLDYQIRLHIQKSKRQFYLNEKRVLGADLRRIFNAVVFSPESLLVIKEGADERRKLVDELFVSTSPRNFEILQDFRKTLKVRNRILKDCMEGIQSLETTEDLLESLNPRFFHGAVEVTWGRLQALKSIQEDFNNAMQYISRNSSVEISVDYVVSGENRWLHSREEIAHLMRTRASDLHRAELAAGVSLVGPQKHEIIFLYGQKDSRFFCSQGQQRAIILSFKMAQIVYHRKAYGVYPVLLLDDVLSELDAEKKDALIQFLHEIKTQTFVTTTDLQLPQSFHLDGTSVVRLKEGKIFSTNSF